MSTTPTTTPSPATYTATVTLKDGSTEIHTGEALRYWHDADGVVIVEAACTCGIPGPDGKVEDTRSRHWFYDIGQDTAAGAIDAEAEVRAHVRRVAERHASIHRTLSFGLDQLMKPAP